MVRMSINKTENWQKESINNVKSVFKKRLMKPRARLISETENPITSIRNEKKKGGGGISTDPIVRKKIARKYYEQL